MSATADREPPISNVAERLRALRTGRSYGRLADPSGVRPTPPRGLFFGVAFGLLFAGIAAVILLVQRFVLSWSDFFAGARWMMAIPAAFILLGLGIAAFCLRRYFRVVQAPIESFPACVIAKRTETRGTENTIHTRYYLGLETEDGSRGEWSAAPGIVSTLREGECGVAFVRLDEVVAFRVA